MQLDASGDGSVTRAELLQFMTSMLPDGFELPKIVTFKRVEEAWPCTAHPLSHPHSSLPARLPPCLICSDML